MAAQDGAAMANNFASIASLAKGAMSYNTAQNKSQLRAGGTAMSAAGSGMGGMMGMAMKAQGSAMSQTGNSGGGL
jgi:hypothetical protein